MCSCYLKYSRHRSNRITAGAEISELGRARTNAHTPHTMRVVQSALCCLLALQCAGAANILGLFHVPSRSHHILGEALMRGFAKRGHNVTLMSSFSMKHIPANFTHILIENILEPFEVLKKDIQNPKPWSMFTSMSEFQRLLTEIPMQSEAMKKLRASGTKFDILIYEEFFNRAFLGLAHEFEAQTVSFSPSQSSFLNHLTGNIAPFSFVPGVMTSFTDRMTFLQRVMNTLIGVGMTGLRVLVTEPAEERLYKKYFKDGPELKELTKNMSLVLANSALGMESPRPYVPNMIPIGGFHVDDEVKELPKDLKTYLDSAKDGFIYCSLGSNVKPSELPKEKILAFTRAFAKFPNKVLWKWDADDVPEISSNVKTKKWLPQRDILAHPNLKVFITHGGMLSTTEAIVNGVPMVGIPFFADQHLNVKTVTSGKFGIAVHQNELTEETLSEAIKEILSNPSYRNEVQKRSKVFQDRPMKPMDTAIYWVEHVLRHGGGQHLRCAGADLNFIEYWLLDVVAFISVIVFVFIKLVVWSCRLCCCRKNKYKSQFKSKSE